MEKKNFIKQYEVDNDRDWNNSITFTLNSDNFEGIINGKRYKINRLSSKIKSGSLYLDKNGDVTIIETLIIDDYICKFIGKFVECE